MTIFDTFNISLKLFEELKYQSIVHNYTIITET